MPTMASERKLKMNYMICWTEKLENKWEIVSGEEALNVRLEELSAIDNEALVFEMDDELDKKSEREELATQYDFSIRAEIKLELEENLELKNALDCGEVLENVLNDDVMLNAITVAIYREVLDQLKSKKLEIAKVEGEYEHQMRCFISSLRAAQFIS